MRRGLFISILLLPAIWLLLNGLPTLGQLVLGVLLTALVLFATSQMRPLSPRPRRPFVALLLLWRVLIDVIRSNIAVAGVILGPEEKRQNSAFMKVPIDMRDPHGLAVLACIITATPGTVWSGLSEDGSELTLHVLDLQNEARWIDTIKNRYERPLMEIFE